MSAYGADDLVRAEVRKIVRESEVDAVLREMRSGRTPRLGEILDYTIKSNAFTNGLGLAKRPEGKKGPAPAYRFQVEQQHLDEAASLLNGAGKATKERIWR